MIFILYNGGGGKSKRWDDDKKKEGKEWRGEKEIYFPPGVIAEKLVEGIVILPELLNTLLCPGL